MATKIQLERLLGKAILDSDFRNQLIHDPQAAAKSLRIVLTDAQAGDIQRIDNTMFDWWAQGFWAARGPAQPFLW